MKKFTTEEFIVKAKLIHGEKYGYSNIKYVNNKTKVIITCKQHGDYLQQPSAHLLGQGCNKCSIDIRANIILKPITDYINQANIKHNFKYDYSLVKYRNLDDDISIICPNHGEFKQRATRHLNGSNCPKCSKLLERKNIDKFIEEASLIHNNLYNYSLSEYVNKDTKIKIICVKHGVFEQTPRNHLKGPNGCPYCSESRGEKLVRDFLIKNDIMFTYQKKFKECKDKSMLPFDFFLPEHNLCIEYNGVQHYKPVSFFGGELGLIGTKKRDFIKSKFCYENNIKLIVIKYNEFVEEKLSLLSRVIPLISHY